MDAYTVNDHAMRVTVKLEAGGWKGEEHGRYVFLDVRFLRKGHADLFVVVIGIIVLSAGKGILQWGATTSSPCSPWIPGLSANAVRSAIISIKIPMTIYPAIRKRPITLLSKWRAATGWNLRLAANSTVYAPRATPADLPSRERDTWDFSATCAYPEKKAPPALFGA